MDAFKYKLLKESWVTGNKGGSALEIIGVTAVMLASFAAWQSSASQRKPSILSELVLFILPSLIACSWPDYGMAIGLLLAVTSLASPTGELSRDEDGMRKRALQEPRKQFLDVYRAMMMILTCLAILAVDFQVFPRRFAKTESFGISLVCFDAFGVCGFILLSDGCWSWEFCLFTGRRQWAQNGTGHQFSRVCS
eukprot:Partr_v1_DN26348_c0_g3_i2_m43337 putative Phosphatidylinositol glycan anchor biosynthesis, class W